MILQSESYNKNVILRYLDEVENDRQMEVLAEICAESVRLRVSGGFPEFHGVEAFGSFMSGMFRGFPDARATVDYLVADDDRVALKWTIEATHDGPLELPSGTYPATHRAVRFTGVDIFRFEDGRIVEDEVEFDIFGILQQLGVDLGADGEARRGG